jgi:hypothetical protein
MATKKSQVTNWVGWVYFAGAMMIVSGALQAIAGLVAIFKHSFYLVSSSNLLAFNYTAWGWIDLSIGVLIFFAGVGIWAGVSWARVVGIFLAALVLVDNIAFIKAYPVWAVISIVISGLVIYALSVHGNEV